MANGTAGRTTISVVAPALGDGSATGNRGTLTASAAGKPASTLSADIDDAVIGVAPATGSALPDRLPVYLGVAALLVLGVLDPPVALAGGLAYEAVRRWNPRGHATS